MKRNKFLGLDLSTQSLSAAVIDISENDLYQTSLDFDDNYPFYETRSGVLIDNDPTVAFTNPGMWIEAVDDILSLLQQRGLTKDIASIGVSAQQHGSVYLNNKAPARLQDTDPSLPLLEQLSDIFSRNVAVVWMDSSTSAECREITQALGGDVNVAMITGSRATERFTGPQIRKFWKIDPQGYEETAHIALVSSFVTSLLVGRIAPLDCGDGFGTNLANIRTGEWSRRAIDATAPNLRMKLPELVRKDEAVGRVSEYLAKKYAFHPETEVIVGSGDNPSSLVGLGLIGDGEKRAISLGTSDTYFGYMPELWAGDHSEGHIFGTADGKFMFLLCFKNGSQARECIKNRHNLSWDEFSKILQTTVPGNHGKIIVPYFLPEITPLILTPQVFRLGGLQEEDVKGNVRAVAEAQVMSMYLHSQGFGEKPKTVQVTAGGSENLGILQIIADVFEAEVQSFEVKDSAALGAALRAARWALHKKNSWSQWRDLSAAFTDGGHSNRVRPREEAVNIYHHEHGLIPVYEACEKFALGLGDHPERVILRFQKAFH